MKFRHASIALSTLFFFSNVYTQDFQTLYRNAVILLDWETETFETKPDDFGTIMIDLVSALIDQSSIIIVSSTTWKNFFMRYTIYNDIKQAFQKGGSNWKKKLQHKESEKFLKYANQLRYFENIASPPQDFNVSEKFSTFFICSLVDVNAWNVKNINDHFYCLIPKKYVQKLKEASPKVNISDDEVLGIRALSLLEVSANEAMGSIQLADDMGKEFNNAVQKLFIPHEDTEFQYEWFLYLKGHGSLAGVDFYKETKIAALSEDEFKRFLQFCNNVIRTRFLFYVSCYVGGKNLVIPFKQKETDLPLIYNFYIASSTLLASTVYTLPLPLITFPIDKDALRKKIYPYFKMYFEELDYYFSGEFKFPLADVIGFVHRTLPSGQYGEYQVPVVRFPYTEWFQLSDVTNKVERLTKTKIDTMNFEKKPLIIKDKDIIIVDVEQPWGEEHSEVYRGILAPIILECTQNSKPPKFIINSRADEIVYYFKKIDARNCNPEDLFRAFLPTGVSELVIIIEELLVKNNFDKSMFAKDPSLYQYFQNYEGNYFNFSNVSIQGGESFKNSLIEFGRYYISVSKGKKLFIKSIHKGFSDQKRRVKEYIDKQTKGLQELSKVFETSAQKQQDIANALGKFANDLNNLEWVTLSL